MSKTHMETRENIQAAGIAQGCPLSPYLFIITLTVIFEDVDALTSNRPSSVLDVSYADDTLLSAADPSKLQEYIDTLIGVAGRYGLKPNWKKTTHLRVHHSGDLFDSDRNPIRVTEQAVYLGSFLTTSGFAFPAVARRLGEARGAFEKIRAVWKHANIPRAKKIQIYSACVLAKLLYSLESECFRKADISKIDAFHCRCLRVILGIPHSMISRVSNATVLETAGSKPLSTTVSSRQLILFGNIAALPDSSMIRSITFDSQHVRPAPLSGKRRRGRPRLSWMSVQYAKALKLCNHEQRILDQYFAQRSDTEAFSWRSFVKQHPIA